MWERTAQWVFRGRLGVFGLEREHAGEDFISTVVRTPSEKQNHHSGFSKIQMALNGAACYSQPVI